MDIKGFENGKRQCEWRIQADALTFENQSMTEAL